MRTHGSRTQPYTAPSPHGTLPIRHLPLLHGTFPRRENVHAHQWLEDPSSRAVAYRLELSSPTHGALAERFESAAGSLRRTLRELLTLLRLQP